MPTGLVQVARRTGELARCRHEMLAAQRAWPSLRVDTGGLASDDGRDLWIGEQRPQGLGHVRDGTVAGADHPHVAGGGGRGTPADGS